LSAISSADVFHANDHGKAQLTALPNFMRLKQYALFNPPRHPIMHADESGFPCCPVSHAIRLRGTKLLLSFALPEPMAAVPPNHAYPASNDYRPCPTTTVSPETMQFCPTFLHQGHKTATAFDRLNPMLSPSMLLAALKNGVKSQAHLCCRFVDVGFVVACLHHLLTRTNSPSNTGIRLDPSGIAELRTRHSPPQSTCATDSSKCSARSSPAPPPPLILPNPPWGTVQGAPRGQSRTVPHLPHTMPYFPPMPVPTSHHTAIVQQRHQQQQCCSYLQQQQQYQPSLIMPVAGHLAQETPHPPVLSVIELEDNSSQDVDQMSQSRGTKLITLK
uniref:DDE_Tnp_1_7 domain-containing protein n=1 Tax=Hydatigena taeniaeformis TaxID=6205 RepID=A0A0R3WTL7_HYDTA